MERTIPAQHLHEKRIGYVLNTEFGHHTQETIANLQQIFINAFGHAIWLPQPNWLHITLMDWVAPLVDYGKNKDKLFGQIQEEYMHYLEGSIKGIGPINIHFNQIHVKPDAIFISGTDQGQYQRIRDNFVSRVNLLPGTKLPPKIIHSTIARFNEAIDLEAVEALAAKHSLSFNERVDHFRLIRSEDSRMDKIKIIKRYYLK